MDMTYKAVMSGNEINKSVIRKAEALRSEVDSSNGGANVLIDMAYVNCKELSEAVDEAIGWVFSGNASKSDYALLALLSRVWLIEG